MAFNSIIIEGHTFNGIGAGTYQLSTVVFGQPSNLLKISPGAVNAKTGITTASISRHLEKDFPAIAGGLERRKLSAILQLQMPLGFTVEEGDGLIAHLSAFATSETLNRIMMGES